MRNVPGHRTTRWIIFAMGVSVGIVAVYGAAWADGWATAHGRQGLASLAHAAPMGLMLAAWGVGLIVETLAQSRSRGPG